MFFSYCSINEKYDLISFKHITLYQVFSFLQSFLRRAISGFGKYVDVVGASNLEVGSW